jgi:hypothetical protein
MPVADQMGDDVVENMRARAEQCRRISDLITSSEMRDRLRTMANEIDADIQRLERRASRPDTN